MEKGKSTRKENPTGMKKKKTDSREKCPRTETDRGRKHIYDHPRATTGKSKNRGSAHTNGKQKKNRVRNIYRYRQQKEVAKAKDQEKEQKKTMNKNQGGRNRTWR